MTSRAPPRTSAVTRGSRRAAHGTAMTALCELRDAKRVEDELEKSQARLINIIDSVTDAIIATHIDGRILLFNAAAERTFRCPAAAAIGEPLSRFVPTRFFDDHVEGDGAFRVVQACRADGEWFRAESAITCIEVAGDNLCTVILRDVSERWRAEELLRKLSRAVEQSADGVCITDASGTIEYVNPAFEALIGRSRDELIGENRAGLADPPVHGHKRHVEESVTPIRDEDGNISHFVAAARDMTRHVRTEEALRRSNDRMEEQTRRIAQTLHDEAGQFLTAAHIALAEAARELPATSVERLLDARQHLDRIEEQLRRVAHELHPRILDDVGLTMALRFLALGFEKRGGTRVIVDAEMQARLRPAVEIAIYRLIQEALSNVRKHARASRVLIRLDHASGSLDCSIADDGVGFDAATLLARLAAGEGGLGLSGIRDRIEALGGTLRIDSTPGHGTAISITIPGELEYAIAPHSRG
jgi:PAS domain S-box-containing protein